MFFRRALTAICVAAVFSPLSAVLAQESVTESTTATVTEIPTTTPSTTTTTEVVLTPSPTPTSGFEYYPPVAGETYDNPSDPNNVSSSETSAEESAAGADGTSDTFINISTGAQIAIISIVVIAGISGLVFGWFWYQRRRRQWEIQGRRRSLVPRISVSERGGFRMSRPVYIRNSLAATPIIAVPPAAAQRGSTGTVSVSNLDLEKGNQRSEFESESKSAVWKTLFAKK